MPSTAKVNINIKNYKKMEKEIKELIRTNQNDVWRHINKRDELRNKMNFCSKHSFQEEVRIASLELTAMEGVIYEYEQMVKDLKIILKSYEEDIAASES